LKPAISEGRVAEPKDERIERFAPEKPARPIRHPSLQERSARILQLNELRLALSMGTLKLAQIIEDAKKLGVNECTIIAGELSAHVLKDSLRRRESFSGGTETGVRNFDALRMAIGVCVSANSALPALMLVYAGIDIAGALYSSDTDYRASGAKFKAWVTRFMLGRLNNAVTADELWRARCGAVHVYGPSSNHPPAANQSPPREISYVIFTPEKADWQRTLDELHRVTGDQPTAANAVLLSVQEIAAAFDQGWQEMLVEVRRDPSKLAIFEAHCAEQFEHMSLPRLA
jgi:hypothetical protein